VKTIIWSHCHEPFVSDPKKPGYVDECAPCLHERTRPPRAMETEMDKKLTRLRVDLTKKQLFSEELIDAVVLAVSDH
jgi:hypothetical protein